MFGLVAVGMGLAIARPRVLGHRQHPAVFTSITSLILLFVGAVTAVDLLEAAADLWRPFLTIAAIMLMTTCAERIGLVDRWSAMIEAEATHTLSLFNRTFAVGVLISVLLNNDAAILLLTPLVLALVRRRYPGQSGITLPFAYAVFASAGVAPFPVANPMNLVVADFAGISFNTYAWSMVPAAIVTWLVSYLVIRVLFRRSLERSLQPDGGTHRVSTRSQRLLTGLLGAVLVGYAVASWLQGPLWAVALGGAVLASILMVSDSSGGAEDLARGVSWSTLVFLFGVVVCALGLRSVGVVDLLATLYNGAPPYLIGATSALGSATLNNHPMAYLNMLALDQAGQSSTAYLAALVGGDLGPRLLPSGSLAGLLWLEILRREDAAPSLGTFVWVGFWLLVPTLAVALLVVGWIGA